MRDVSTDNTTQRLHVRCEPQCCQSCDKFDMTFAVHSQCSAARLPAATTIVIVVRMARRAYPTRISSALAKTNVLQHWRNNPKLLEQRATARHQHHYTNVHITKPSLQSGALIGLVTWGVWAMCKTWVPFDYNTSATTQNNIHCFSKSNT